MFLLAVYAVQRFWFLRAWVWLGTISNGEWRFGLRAGLIALAAALFVALIDPLLGHGVSRLSVSHSSVASLGTFNFGKSLTTFARIWVIASFFGFLAVELVGALEWGTNVAAHGFRHSG